MKRCEWIRGFTDRFSRCQFYVLQIHWGLWLRRWMQKKCCPACCRWWQRLLLNSRDAHHFWMKWVILSVFAAVKLSSPLLLYYRCSHLHLIAWCCFSQYLTFHPYFLLVIFMAHVSISLLFSCTVGLVRPWLVYMSWVRGVSLCEWSVPLENGQKSNLTYAGLRSVFESWLCTDRLYEVLLLARVSLSLNSSFAK